jgi:hypothetical protein
MATQRTLKIGVRDDERQPALLRARRGTYRPEWKDLADIAHPDSDEVRELARRDQPLATPPDVWTRFISKIGLGSRDPRNARPGWDLEPARVRVRRDARVRLARRSHVVHHSRC